MTPGLEAAVRDRVIDRATAERLQPYLTGAVAAADTADPDDEKLRLVTGFNDIFVTIGLLLFLGALVYLILDVDFASGPLKFASASVSVAVASWGLAEFFTRRKRLALPSIVLLVIFVLAVFGAVVSLLEGLSPQWQGNNDLAPVQLLVAGIAAAVAAVVHWLRFHVPITVAAGAGAVAVVLVALIQMLVPGLLTVYPTAVFLPLGLAVFALAMWFDSSDLKRQTRRTDIAFWLHLLAAPMIVHPLLAPVMTGTPSLSGAVLVLAVFLLLAEVALLVDRRAILVSSLAYLAYAAGTLIAASGVESSAFAVATLAVGAVVLLLSAAWKPLRRAVMALLPHSLRSRLPAVA